MVHRIFALALLFSLAWIPQAASAKGCLKGAAVGGVAGHVAGGHGLLGAAAGCAIGHHRAAQKEQQQANQVSGSTPAKR
jgi:outer membrane lipoprotein SlyB